MQIADLYQIFLRHPYVQTDTRRIQPGQLFFALKGDRFNGNLFARQALEAGAAYAVVDEDPGFKDERLIWVADVLHTLQQLAKHHRQQFNIPFLAITGSNGKTTTKELIHSVLSSTYQTYTTQGNLNNHIGIPLTLLAVKPDAAMAVVEMGANHQQEIASYCTYTLPTHGLITNVGKAHLEGFGGEAGVRKGKGELFDYIRTANGVVFICSDYDYLDEMSAGIAHRFRYGSNTGEVVGHRAASQPFLRVQVIHPFEATIQTQLVGDYNLPNVLAAVAVGVYFKVPSDKIVAALCAYTPSNSRSQLLRVGTNEIILDAYNANPSSMKVAIDNFARQPHANKVVLLGAMAELGEESLAEHSRIISQLQEHSWKEVVLVGGDFLKLQHPYRSFPDAATAAVWYRQQNWEHSLQLIKGSRSSKMELLLSSTQPTDK